MASVTRRHLPGAVAMAAAVLLATAAVVGAAGLKPTVITLDIPAPKDSAGGILIADVNDDGRMDYLVTVPGHLAVYGADGRKLWITRVPIAVGGQSESQGLPGHHGPGVAAGDVDGDGRCEVVFLTKDSVLHVLDGATGRDEARAKHEYQEAIRLARRETATAGASSRSWWAAANLHQKMGEYQHAQEARGRAEHLSKNEWLGGEHELRIAGPDSGFLPFPETAREN